MFGQRETVADFFAALASHVRQGFEKCRKIYTDFDGVWTCQNLVMHSAQVRRNGKGKVYSIRESEGVLRSRADSLGIELLQQVGLYDKEHYDTARHLVDIAIISREPHPLLECVSRKIKVKVQGSVLRKAEAMQSDMDSLGLHADEVIWIGNDHNDLPCFPVAGLSVAVADSHPLLFKRANYITMSPGGKGAVREVIELVLYAKNKHPYLETK